MKNLNECKEYFKDLYINCLAEDAFEKNIFECTELAQYETFCNALRFIYGKEYDVINPEWRSEALKEFYAKM